MARATAEASARYLLPIGPQTCGMAALHRHIRDELLQVIVGDVLGARGASPSRARREGGSVRGQVVGYEEGGGGLRHHSAGGHAGSAVPTVKLAV